MLSSISETIRPREDSDCVIGPGRVCEISEGQVELALLSELGKVVSEHVGIV